MKYVAWNFTEQALDRANMNAIIAWDLHSSGPAVIVAVDYDEDPPEDPKPSVAEWLSDNGPVELEFRSPDVDGVYQKRIELVAA